MRIIMAITLMLLITAAVSYAGPAEQTGIGVGITLPSTDENPCPPAVLLLNYDGSAENGYAFRFMGQVPPDYGAFAEGYEGVGTVCGIQYHFSQNGAFVGQPMDCYLYDSDGMNPSSVLSATIEVSLDEIAFWPEISVHDVDTVDGEVGGGFFVGFWGHWPYLGAGWYIAADTNGPGGMPRTNIAPGIGYPTGWNDPSIVWGPTEALGIGAYLTDEVIPVEESSWGAVKALY